MSVCSLHRFHTAENELYEVQFCDDFGGFDEFMMNTVTAIIGGYHRERDACVRWEVNIRRFHYKLRVGFTDDRDSLLLRRRRPQDEAHAFILSDAIGRPDLHAIYAAGRRVSTAVFWGRR